MQRQILILECVPQPSTIHCIRMEFLEAHFTRQKLQRRCSSQVIKGNRTVNPIILATMYGTMNPSFRLTFGIILDQRVLSEEMHLLQLLLKNKAFKQLLNAIREKIRKRSRKSKLMAVFYILHLLQILSPTILEILP